MDHVMIVVRILGWWVTRYPPLLVVFLLLVMPMWGGLKGVGLPYLFRHDEFFPAFAAGTVAVLATAQINFVTFLIRTGQRGWKPKLSLDRDVRIGFIGLLAIVAFPLFLLPGWSLTLGVGAGVGGVAFLHSIASKVRFRRFEDRAKARRQRIDDEIAKMHGRQAIYTWFFMAFYVTATAVLWVAPEKHIPPGGSYCLLLAIVTGIYGYVRFHWSKCRNLVYVGFAVGLMLLYALFFDVRNRIDGVPYETQADLSARNATLLDSKVVLDNARDRLKAAGADPLIVVVCVSGGGIRASAWSTRVLAEIEKHVDRHAKYRGPGFPYHIRVIAGASGGMVGAGYYVTALQEPFAGMEPKERFNIDYRALAERSSIADVLKHVAIWALPYDRGTSLQRRWIEGDGAVLGRTFAELEPGERTGWRPSLIFTPAFVEDSRRLVISNLDCEALISTDRSRSGVEYFQVFGRAERATDGLPVAAAARMSASFPYVSPASRLPTNPSRRVVDAGYYDNYGVNIASHWIEHHCKGRTEERVLMIRIRDSTDDRKNLAKKDGFLKRWFSGLLNPVEAFWASRTGTTAFRNEEQVQRLKDTFGKNRFHEVVILSPKEVSLSWHLSETERIALNIAIGEDSVQDPIKAAVKWWLGEN